MSKLHNEYILKKEKNNKNIEVSINLDQNLNIIDYKFIIICATGRSGSTTLQRIINTIPNSNINGENYGAINNLLKCYNDLKYTVNMSQNYYKDMLTTSMSEEKNINPAWANSFNFNMIKKNIQDLIINILDSNNKNKIIGFKEIRFFDELYLLDIFLELFPNTKIICHYKENTDVQCLSGWWTNTENNKEHLIKYNEQLIEYSKININSYLFTFEKIFELEEIKKLFLFLEEPLDIDKYQKILLDKLE